MNSPTPTNVVWYTAVTCPRVLCHLTSTHHHGESVELQENAPVRCALHPAYEADYCPACGTSAVIR